MDRDKILVVDDLEINRAILGELFREHYDIVEAENGKVALDILHKKPDIKIVLLDIRMPVLDGFGVLKEMSETGLIADIPVILITSEADDETSIESYGLGASDIIRKPFNPKIVTQRVRNVLELYDYKKHLEERIEEQTREIMEKEERLKQMNFSLIDTLSSAVEFRNVESGKHIKRTRLLIDRMLRSIQDDYDLTDEQIEMMASAAALHDVGKIAIPDKVLLKPGKLTPEEFEIIKTHTVKGSEMIETFNLMQKEEYYQYCYDIVRFHHERWDGRGYPDGLVGEEIPIWAQAAGIVDVYDALTSKRVYKDALPHQKAVEMIAGGECGTFNPQLIEEFKKIAPDLEKLSKETAD
jgi:putative two-component system response regulator